MCLCCKESQDDLLSDNLGADLIIKNISGRPSRSPYPAAGPRMRLLLQPIYRPSSLTQNRKSGSRMLVAIGPMFFSDSNHLKIFSTECSLHKEEFAGHCPTTTHFSERFIRLASRNTKEWLKLLLTGIV